MYSKETLGKVFHDFRVNRNYSLKQVAGSEVSISQISRFERGEADISLTKFLTALSNMKVEVGEFINAANDYDRSDTIAFMSQLIPLEYKRDKTGFQKLKAEQERKFKENPSVYQYHLNVILAQSFICKCDADIPFPQDYLDEVCDYLFGVEEWNILELILIGNLYMFFDIGLLDKMGREILHDTRRLKSNRSLTHIVLLNIYETCIFRNHLKIAEYYKEQIKPLLADETALYERNIYLFLSGLLLFKQGGKKQGEEMMDHSIQIYKWLMCSNLADNYCKDKENHTN